MVITQGLLITAIGMGLVFLMIIALWGIMAGMVAIFTPKEKLEGVEENLELDAAVEAEPGLLEQSPQLEMAAAVAVAYALAAQTSTPTHATKQTTGWNPSTKAYQPFRQHKGW